MAERRLLPAVRAAAPDTIIVAAGLSCRQQIGHGENGRSALHPAEVLRDALILTDKTFSTGLFFKIQGFANRIAS